MLDDISVDLISAQDKVKIEALVQLKVPEQDRPYLFRGDPGTNGARLKALLLQDAGATIVHTHPNAHFILHLHTAMVNMMQQC